MVPATITFDIALATGVEDRGSCLLQVYRSPKPTLWAGQQKIEWRGSIDLRARLNGDNVSEWILGLLCVIVLFSIQVVVQGNGT